MITFHKVCLLICAVVGFPFAALAILGMVAVIMEAIQDCELHFEAVIGISVAISIVGLYVWCLVLGLSLRCLSRTPPTMRPTLFAFYCLAGVFASAETIMPSAPHGFRRLLFAPVEMAAVVAFFVTPMLALLFESRKAAHESRPAKNTKPDDTMVEQGIPPNPRSPTAHRFGGR